MSSGHSRHRRRVACVGACVPLALGFVAGAVGLGPTMWILVLAPLALLALTPKR